MAVPSVPTLAAGELAAQVTGGALLSVVSLRHRGEELLVAPEALPEGYRVHGTRAGITLLHPWANRLGADRFTVAGRTVDVTGAPVGRDDAGLPMHGLAAPGTWAPEATGSASARAVTAFPAQPAFPWSHTVEVELALEAPAQLTVTTTVRPDEPGRVPVAFGWHPYIRLPGSARPDRLLALPARRHLHADERGLPDLAATREPAEDKALGARTFDDGCDEILEGATFALRDAERRVAVRLDSGYPAAQVFAPPEVDVVSLEPMTAPTDALRTGRELPFAEPGSTRAARFTVAVTTR